MSLPTNTFAQIVSNFATAAQGAASGLLDFSVGSIPRSVAQATAGVVLWLQALILQVLSLTRAATSSGSDLDSFMADYGLLRLPAANATGTVTFARFTATQQALIPINAGVQTSDGSQKFFVTPNTALSSYNPTLGGYVIAAGTAGLTVPVMAVAAGSAGNIQAGTLSTITTAIPGVDTASNPAAFLSGIDAESDPALRQRFVLYLASLSKATYSAIKYAVVNTQQGLTCTINENVDYNGTVDNGHFYVVVDDGSGYPPSSILTAVSNAVDAVRALTIRFDVYAPTPLLAAVSMSLSTSANADHQAVVQAVTVALQNFIDALPLGFPLPYTQLAAIAYSIPGVVNASAITLNGSATDLTATAQNKILAGVIAVN